MTKNQPPKFGIVGWKDSGKTTLVEHLIEEFTRRGLTVSAIKHAHHSFEIDHKNRDSYLFRSAGARRTAIVSRNRWAMIHELRTEKEPPLDEIIEHIGPCDLLLIEGYKFAKIDKIEIRNLANDHPGLAPDDEHIKAIAFQGTTIPDNKNPTNLPTFHADEINEMADFITRHLDLKL